MFTLCFTEKNALYEVFFFIAKKGYPFKRNNGIAREWNGSVSDKKWLIEMTETTANYKQLIIMED